jgi:hypothetical protein
MSKRTSPDDLQGWDDAPDLDRIVNDKRASKRATPAKGRRRNRRYENRLLKSQTDLDVSIDDLGNFIE